LQGTVELGLAPYIIRAVKYAEKERYDALVLDVDTLGGRIDAAIEIRDALLDSKVPTVAWVNKRAISAGALISIACRKIFFTPGSTMGAATPIQETGGSVKDVDKKYVSYFRGEMRATAEKNGHPVTIAESMVQAPANIKGLVKKGDVLTLTDRSALKTGMSNGTVSSRGQLLSLLHLPDAKIELFKINWAERLVRFITDPTISGFLMSGGILGVILELQAPGLSLPGILGVLCLGLFFFGKFLVQLAGWEEVLIFLIGLIFVALEFFVAPGSIVFAVIGLACIIGSLFFAGISPKIPLDFSFPSVAEHLNSLAIGLSLTVIGVIVMVWIFSRFPERVPLVLAEKHKLGSSLSDEESAESRLIGRRGILLTDLHPSGKAEIEGKVYEVVSEGAFLERGAAIEVSDIRGIRTIVRAYTDKDSI